MTLRHLAMSALIHPAKWSAAGAWQIFHVELLPQAFPKFLRKQPRGRVVRTVGCDRPDGNSAGTWSCSTLLDQLSSESETVHTCAFKGRLQIQGQLI